MLGNVQKNTEKVGFGTRGGGRGRLWVNVSKQHMVLQRYIGGTKVLLGPKGGYKKWSLRSAAPDLCQNVKCGMNLFVRLQSCLAVCFYVYRLCCSCVCVFVGL